MAHSQAQGDFISCEASAWPRAFEECMKHRTARNTIVAWPS